MPKRRTRFFKGGLYHIYNHGAGQSNILTCDEDFKKMYTLLQYYSEKFNLSVPAWCFMPNHFHLLVHQNDKIPALQLPSLIFNVYTRWFNRVHNLRGTLIESPYKVKPIANTNYFTHLCLYIHANPVKANLCKKPDEWPWSNLDQFIHDPPPPSLAGFFPKQDEYLEILTLYCEEAKCA